ncbi:PblB-type antireceptor [Salmonella phage 36]|uniref:PblB-type antireceptor n=1 Tax=Salmonella phage 36 TaxID=1654889 RepID=A0A0N7CA29_9CAUD|nr:PblB-type antireceptor [Salmonella phage 36]AKJ73995.1 PblB-type antireceptor [Salmonella phage 36]
MSKEMKYDEFEANVIANHMQLRGAKNDASDMGIWTAQELHKIKAQAYEKEYPAGSALRVFPVRPSFLIQIKLLNIRLSTK